MPEHERPRYQPTEPKVLKPSPEAIAELAQVRHQDMLSLSERMGRVQQQPRADRWERVSSNALWAAIAAGVAAIPLFGAREQVEEWVFYLYGAVLAILAITAFGCRWASKDVAAERSDSISAIKQDLDRWIATYQDDDT